jgi:hypothetical protein
MGVDPGTHAEGQTCAFLVARVIIKRYIVLFDVKQFITHQGGAIEAGGQCRQKLSQSYT